MTNLQPGRPGRLACLGWGSLLWDPRTLSMAGPFREDGPRLPIEFSRVSLDGRVTLVIDPRAPLVQTYWCPLDVSTLDRAIEDLRVREKVAPERRSEWIGAQARADRSLDAGRAEEAVRETIAEWLGSSEVEAVVWTALPSRWPSGELDRPDCDQLLAHLESLSGSARARAEEYIRRAPASVRTPNRARFEAELGWLPVD